MAIIDPELLYGTWRLVASESTDPNGKPLPPPWGPFPMGRLVLSRSGRMMAVLCDGRIDIPDGELRKYSSYCGAFVVEGDLLTTKIDAASDETRIGSLQPRRLSLHGDGLMLAPPSGPDGTQRRIYWKLETRE